MVIKKIVLVSLISFISSALHADQSGQHNCPTFAPIGSGCQYRNNDTPQDGTCKLDTDSGLSQDEIARVKEINKDWATDPGGWDGRHGNHEMGSMDINSGGLDVSTRYCEVNKS